jgi:tetratricopeptide (TPR) repeat protein
MKKGDCYLKLGNNDLAFENFNISLSIYKRRYIKNHTLIGKTYCFIGKYYMRIKDFEEALMYIEEGVRIC